METVEDMDIYEDMRGKQRKRKEKRREKRSIIIWRLLKKKKGSLKKEKVKGVRKKYFVRTRTPRSSPLPPPFHRKSSK